MRRRKLKILRMAVLVMTPVFSCSLGTMGKYSPDAAGDGFSDGDAGDWVSEHDAMDNAEGSRCGDGVVDPGEECDDGAMNSDTEPDACRADCFMHRCGDGVVDTGEMCDDGNTVDEDGCTSACSRPGCGNGTPEPELGEECDDGNADSTDTCLATCLNAACGDGFVWTGHEECDTDMAVACVTECGTEGAGWCSEACTLPAPPDCRPLPGECCGPADCDDGDECTNDECPSNVCRNAAAPDGQACSDGHCCGGACVECCESGHCDDSNPCTIDTCLAGACAHSPAGDMAACPGGICCGAVCRAGGDCCSNEDCSAGCTGAARPCGTIDSLTCASQSGCDLGSTIQCYGTPGPCSSHGLEMVCDGCGCDWNDGSCAGTSDACSSFGGNAACLGCGCLWGLPCAGMHEPCASYAGRTECEGQMGCRWSLCEDYTCT